MFSYVSCAECFQIMLFFKTIFVFKEVGTLTVWRGNPAPKAPNVWGSLGLRASLFAGGRRPPAKVAAVNRKLLRMFRGKRLVS